jgi:hypothetical protein
MAELSTVLGTLMTSLVHARRMADEETAAVAEYYRDNPLLAGMSLPRVRVPELTIEMPITIDGLEDETDAQLDTPTKIQKTILDHLEATLPSDLLRGTKSRFRKAFSDEAKTRLNDINIRHKSMGGKVSREEIVRAVDRAFQYSLQQSGLDKSLPVDQRESLSDSIRHKVSAISLKRPSRPHAFITSAETSKVKETATPSTAVNLRITLREEGLEWSTGRSRDGSTVSQLQPE